MDDDGPSFSSTSPLFTPPGSPVNDEQEGSVAIGEAPAIPGLFYLKDFLREHEAEAIVSQVIECGYFDVARGRDQAVLFGRRERETEHDDADDEDGGLPSWASGLLQLIERRLGSEARMPSDVLQILFAPEDRSAGPITHTRQLILNVYTPGQGIAPHIDIAHRFLDGIMILSFGSGIAMDFRRLCSDDDEEELHDKGAHSVYLLPGSLCILTQQSRWQWTHGIAPQLYDRVVRSDGQVQRIDRGPRLGITIRWLRIQQEQECDFDTTEDHSIQARLRVT